MNCKSGQYSTYSIRKSQPALGYRSNNHKLSGSETDVSSSTENLTQEDRFVIRNTLRQEPQGQENNRNSPDSSYNTLIIHGASDDHRLSTGSNSSYLYHGKHASNGGTKDLSCRRSFDPSMSEITNIPDDYLSQSQVLKHLAKEVKVPSHYFDRTNENTNTSLKRGINLLSEDGSPLNRSFRSKSKSQPDLSKSHKISKPEPVSITRHTVGNTRKEQRCMQMVDHLVQENNNLKLELEACYQKVAKSQKLEQEIGKVHKAHEDLVESCERRERLERSARSKLQTEVRRLQETNRSLREHVDVLSKQLIATRVSHSGGIETSELSKRDALIAQLVSQNKELMATKDRQDIELSAQRVTLEEQRTHIDILDTALTNAQSNVVRLEEECRKKQMHVDRVAQLQRALSSLQLASDKREQTERKLRIQLENELRFERSRNKTHDANRSDSVENIAELKRTLREKDERIMQLEGEVAKWEQRYLEESELRQAAIDAASIPKDAKIAALEKTSQESEKIIAEARNDKLRQMDEVHAAQKKVTDLESRMKELESKLAEKDAMIKVLHKKHSFDKDTAISYQSMSLSHHTPHSSLNTTDLSTEDLGFGSSTSYSGSVNSSFHQRGNKYNSSNQSFDQKSLDDQLKELDSQLLSKTGLCCFPGFAHSGSVPRKGKTSQPLLASITGNSSSSSSGNDAIPLFQSAGGLLQGLISVGGQNANNRPDDMMLLEKQGLSSQAQRQESSTRSGSLPPSSLPRPKRHRKSSVVTATKLGEYGRLSDSEISTAPPSPKKISSNDLSDNRSNSETTDIVVLAGKKLFGDYAAGRLSDPTSERSANNPTNTKSNNASIIPTLSGGRNNNNNNNERAGSEPRSSSVRSYTTGSKCGDTSFERYPNKIAPENPPTINTITTSSTITKTRDSPTRSNLLKWGEYNKLNILGNERKVIMNSSTPTTATVVCSSEVDNKVKVRTSPVRSLIPAPKKQTAPMLIDYSSCLSSTSSNVQKQKQEEQLQYDQQKLGPNVQSKLRIFSPGGVPGRRGSLQRDCKKTEENVQNIRSGIVRSLPIPNKYHRIHF